MGLQQNSKEQQSNGIISTNDDETADIFGGMAQQNDQNEVEEKANENDNNKEDKEDEVEEEQKQTFLSVWQEQHREQLAKKGKEEREKQEQLIEAGKDELDKFNEQRRGRIEQARKDQKARELDLRQDYDAVFQHGSIWQQVAKLVDLKTKNPKRERMRDLLIILKNKDEKKSIE